MEISMPMGIEKRHKFVYWLVSHPILCLDMAHLVGNLPYSINIQYSNKKLNEYGIFEYSKNGHSLEALAGVCDTCVQMCPDVTRSNICKQI